MKPLCVAVLLAWGCSPYCLAQPSVGASQTISMSKYSITISESSQTGAPPQLTLQRGHETVFIMPIVSGLASPSSEEHLSAITHSLHKSGGSYELTATAQSNLWIDRRFEWRFFPDHIEFEQFASGSGKLGRCYFLSNGISGLWDNGSTDGFAWNTSTYADRYFAPNPNHANQFEFNIAMPQILGFSVGRNESSARDFRPERMTGIFAPPPLFLAFHLDNSWTGIGIGAKPGEYTFPALEYSGSRYAGASFYVDYMGYRTAENGFASPVLDINMAWSPLDTLQGYTSWLTAKQFATAPVAEGVAWHHLPIFCGWAEQTVESVPRGEAPNKMSTQANYERWLATLDQRGLPIGTIVIDDKWQRGYGTFDVDQQKWPDLKGFIAAQHAKGRHVLLWVPVAHPEGLPASLCVTYQDKCVIADVGKSEYEAWLRPRIRHLVQDLGVDGFKEDWVNAPAAPGLPLTGTAIGIEFVRRFQSILYSETHRWKPDALVETQTTNALFHESSDVIRLNDIWYATRNVIEMMRLRAHIAEITGWPLVDTDNASSTNLKEWWDYMQAQPSIGIPALYFITRTETTQESPSPADWTYLAALWRQYIDSLRTGPPQ